MNMETLNDIWICMKDFTESHLAIVIIICFLFSLIIFKREPWTRSDYIASIMMSIVIWSADWTSKKMSDNTSKIEAEIKEKTNDSSCIKIKVDTTDTTSDSISDIISQKQVNTTIKKDDVITEKEMQKIMEYRYNEDTRITN